MTIKCSAKQIMDGLSEQGFSFRNFSLESEGDYTVDDADWNYKDIPHLKHIHHLVEGVPTVVGDEFIASVIVQRVMGLRIPLCLVSYESSQSPLVQTYYVSWLWFVLIIETHYEVIGINRTKVITTYNLGSPRFLQWAFPIIRYALTKNYKALMSGDIPMRERRGYLRRRGFSFKKDAATYGFRETLKIQSTRVIPPRVAGDTPKHVVRINEVDKDGDIVMIGDPDHLGLQLQRVGTVIRVFPRLCLHEGACLDASSIVGDEISCPWHGRVYAPCMKIDISIDTKRQVYEDDVRRIVFENGTITISQASTIT